MNYQTQKQNALTALPTEVRKLAEELIDSVAHSVGASDTCSADLPIDDYRKLRIFVRGGDEITAVSVALITHSMSFAFKNEEVG